MIPVFLGCAVLLSAIVYEIYRIRMNSFDTSISGSIGFGFVAGLIVYLVVSLVGAACYTLSSDVSEVGHEAEGLRAVQTDESNSWSYFLVWARGGDHAEYTYMVQHEDGGVEIETISIEDVTVYETDETPHMEIPIMGVPCGPWSYWSCTTYESTTHIRFYVPEGSIQEPSYDVSLPEGS